jgi:phage anti-repressor protein
MDALGVKKDANYTALEKTISEDKKLSPEQIRQLAQFQSNTFAIVNAQSLLTLLDILKNSGQKPSEFGSQIDKIEQDLKQLTLSFLQNPMQSRDIAKDIAMLRKSAETLKS